MKAKSLVYAVSISILHLFPTVIRV